MKIYIKIIIVLLILLGIGGYFTFSKPSGWKTYINTNPSFSFKYPSSWGEPRVFKNDKNADFQIDFGNYAFSVNNGYYFSNVNGERPTISQLIQAYQDDMNSKNEVKDFQTKDIQIDNHTATEVTIDNIIGTHFTDVYISEDPQDQGKFILITGDKNFVDTATFNQIVSSFKFIK